MNGMSWVLYVVLSLGLAAPSWGHVIVRANYLKTGTSQFDSFPAGNEPISFTAELEDNYNAWDGEYFTAPHDGLYHVVLQVWAERIAAVPAVMAIQVWDGRPECGPGTSDPTCFWAWTPKKVLSTEINFAYALPFNDYIRLSEGQRIRFRIVSTQPWEISHAPWETKLSIVEH